MNRKKGIAILIAVIAVSAMLLIALAISDISYKEQIITFFGRDSKIAFYASNAGVECALFHDRFGGGGGSNGDYYFATTSASDNSGPVRCADRQWGSDTSESNGTMITTFYFNIATTPASCAIVKVSKRWADPVLATKIESRGYNTTCDTSSDPSNPQLSNASARNIERALLMTYCNATTCPNI